MGYVFSAFFLGYALFEVPAGLMGDKWGSRAVLTRIVLLWSVFTALTGAMWQFSSDITWVLAAMLVVRFAFGCGEAGAYPNVNRITGMWFPFRERGMAQGLVWMSARLGGAMAPLIIGRLTKLMGWRLGFVVLGSVGAIWAIFFFNWFRDSPDEKEDCNEAERSLIREGAISASHGHVKAPWGKLLLLPSLYALCLASASASFAWYFFATWQPRFFEQVFGIATDSPWAELQSGLPFVGGAFGSLAGGWLSDRLVRRTGSRRWGRSLMGIGGFGMAGVFVLAAAFAPTALLATGLLCLASFFNDLAIPTIWAACNDIGGRYTGTLSGIMNMLGGVGSVTSPIFIPTLNVALTEYDYPARERWLIILGAFACAWWVGALAWAGINAARPLEEATQ
jgi:MFS family permease